MKKYEYKFVTDSEIQLSTEYIKKGYVITPVEDIEAFGAIQNLISNIIVERYQKKFDNELLSLNNVHLFVLPTELNSLRLDILNIINNQSWVRPTFYFLVRGLLDKLVGNELVMQNRLNLSVQMPGDASSLLPVHSDTWSGDSPYEAVVWLPLVDCYRTKSMYILPPEKSQELYKNISKLNIKNSESLYKLIEKDIEWIDIKEREVLIFNQNLPHGNRVNEENETRWSINCRFKSIFSPYADKKIGEFFEPINIKATTRIGNDYEMPKIFNQS